MAWRSVHSRMVRRSPYSAALHVPAAPGVLKSFAIGASSGDTRSLIAPMAVRAHRTAVSWTGDGLLLRISAGVEAPEDRQVDLVALLDVLAERMEGEAAR